MKESLMSVTRLGTGMRNTTHRRLKLLALTAQVAPVLRFIIGALLLLSISCGTEGGLFVSGTTTRI